MTTSVIDSAQSPERSRHEQAADWLLRLRAPNVPLDVIGGWMEWCASDVKNHVAFDRIQSVWDATEGDAALHAQAQALLERPRRRRARFTPGRWAAAAALVLAVAFGISSWHRPGAQFQARFETHRAEQETLTLPDGSRVDVGGGTAVAFDYDHRARRAVLREGEAFFTVQPDRSKPFIVDAGPLTVTAIGTAFNVRRDAGSVYVTVAEGAVDVRARNNVPKGSSDLDVRARGGHQVRYRAGHLSSTVDAIDPAIASSFQQGKLQYIDEPLKDVIASLNRYSQREIELGDSGLGELHFTGTVFEGHIDDWLEGLDAVFPVRIVQENGRVVLARK